MPPPENKPRASSPLPPIDRGTRAGKALFLHPDLAESAGTRERVGKYLNAETHAVHLTGSGDGRKLVTRGGTDVAEHVRNTNGSVFYEAHGGRSNNLDPDGTPQRKLEFARKVDNKTSQTFLGQSATAKVLAESMPDARSVTILACKYGRGSAVKEVSDAFSAKRENAQSLPSVFAPRDNFIRQTIPGPGVNPSSKALAKIPAKERGNMVMTRPTNNELHAMMGNKHLWNSNHLGGESEPQLPRIQERLPPIATNTDKSMKPRSNDKLVWR